MIDAVTLARLIGAAETAGDAGVAIIDCRFDLAAPAAGAQAYLSGHIPGARYADLNRDLSAPIAPGTGRHPLPAPAGFAAWVGARGVGNATQVVAYDAGSGAFAARLWWILRWLGHCAVAVLDGGYAAWLSAGGAVRAHEEIAAAGRIFTPRPDPATAVTGAQVQEMLHDPRRLLIDARAPERYAGIIEPLDSVAGHVPGARNYPFGLNLDAHGRFLPSAELRRRWLAVLGRTAPADAVAMCGSGVTACHNLLALEAAGLTGAKLYAGSWSEWIADPGRPVATGDLP